MQTRMVMNQVPVASGNTDLMIVVALLLFNWNLSGLISLLIASLSFVLQVILMLTKLFDFNLNSVTESSLWR